MQLARRLLLGATCGLLIATATPADAAGRLNKFVDWDTTYPDWGTAGCAPFWGDGTGGVVGYYGEPVDDCVGGGCAGCGSGGLLGTGPLSRLCGRLRGGLALHGGCSGGDCGGGDCYGGDCYGDGCGDGGCYGGDCGAVVDGGCIGGGCIGGGCGDVVGDCGGGCDDAYGCGYGCVVGHGCLLARIHARLRARHACGPCGCGVACGPCGGCDSCVGCDAGCDGAGCTGVGCAAGGCSGAGCGGSDVLSVLEGTPIEGVPVEGVPVEGVPIEGVPIEGGTPTFEPAPALPPETIPPPVPEPVEATQTRRDVFRPYRVVGLRLGGERDFARGLSAYWRHELPRAHALLADACDADPNDALAFYFLALTQRELGQDQLANETLAIATDVEARHPIANWGKRMERVQGAKRLWIESARR